MGFINQLITFRGPTLYLTSENVALTVNMGMKFDSIPPKIGIFNGY